jgi:hypothetical protein
VRAFRFSVEEKISMARFNALVTLTLALSSPLWLQAPQEDEPTLGQRDIYGRPIGQNANDNLLESLQGAWRLMAIQDEFLPISGRSHQGYMTFSGRFMAIEIHMRWTETTGEVVEDASQSGIHEIDFIGPARIRTTTLIGSYLDDEEILEWEVQGFGREFEVDVKGDRLVLTRDVGSQLIFRRQTSGTGILTDIYGVGEGARGDTDIFGAPIQSSASIEKPVEQPEPEDPDDSEDPVENGGDGE